MNLRGITPIDSASNIYEYKPVYRILATGRIAEVGGGLQSCTREMKQASVEGISDLKNYDLRASQVNGLIHQFKIQDIDATWLEEYVGNPDNKQRYAEELGIGVDCWKTCLLLIIMGGSTNKKKPKQIGSSSMIDTEFYVELENDLRQKYDQRELSMKVEEKRLELLEKLSPLLKPLNQWRRSLKKEYYKSGREFGREYQERIQIKNYLKIPYFVDEYTPSKLSARILQGQEAAFIHEITRISGRYGYEVIGNEHDGVITIGEIPVEAIGEVKQKLNIDEYELVEKSFT